MLSHLVMLTLSNFILLGSWKDSSPAVYTTTETKNLPAKQWAQEITEVRENAALVFERFLPIAFARHEAACKQWPTGQLLGPFALGVTNINLPLQIHNDRKDPKSSGSIVAYSGNFSEGGIVFPSLNCIVKVHPGSMLLFRGRLLPHAVLPWQGERVATIFTSHENSL
jgi:hypothetical protein